MTDLIGTGTHFIMTVFLTGHAFVSRDIIIAEVSDLTCKPPRLPSTGDITGIPAHCAKTPF
jgi:hypothetical protein